MHYFFVTWLLGASFWILAACNKYVCEIKTNFLNIVLPFLQLEKIGYAEPWPTIISHTLIWSWGHAMLGKLFQKEPSSHQSLKTKCNTFNMTQIVYVFEAVSNFVLIQSAVILVWCQTGPTAVRRWFNDIPDDDTGIIIANHEKLKL